MAGRRQLFKNGRNRANCFTDPIFEGIACRMSLIHQTPIGISGSGDGVLGVCLQSPRELSGHTLSMSLRIFGLEHRHSVEVTECVGGAADFRAQTLNEQMQPNVRIAEYGIVSMVSGFGRPVWYTRAFIPVA